jgi:uncharacterized protein with NRDE domain
MCLIVFAYQQHPTWRLVLAASRDEFLARPAASMAHWLDAPEILAGRDLTGGGTWFGITRSGRFAAVTNYRDPRDVRNDAPSRGLLVSDFLRGGEPPRVYLERLSADAYRYNGFSLLVGDGNDLCYFCNRENIARELKPGLYGLSNHLLDEPWPKVQRAKRELMRLLNADTIDTHHLFELLADRQQALDEALPNTGISRDWERLLSSIFIASPVYGTRSSTALLVAYDGGISAAEREHLNGETRSYQWSMHSHQA